MSTHVSVAHAARMSGRSEKTIRRWIAKGSLPSSKVNGVYAIDTADLAQLVGDMSSPGVDTGVDTDVHPGPDVGLDILRAEAMAAYTRSLLEPLVAHVAQLEGTVRDQAETIGRQAAELDMLRAAQPRQAANLTPAAPETPPEPRAPSPWPLPPSPNVLRSWPLVAGLAVVLAIVLLAWRW